jgi:LuxR family maltose regulon positive regulatory protein
VRLDAHLDAALEPTVRLTLVSAPPGYGKSVAVAGWISAHRIPCAWLGLEAADDDPARLARDLLVALDGVRPGSAALAYLIAPGTVPDPRALAGLVVDAVAGDDHDVVIVLDDCQVVRSPDTHALLRALVERLPPFGHLVLVTREDPALPIGRLRAHGALVELRAEHLRFTADEAASLLADAGLDPQPAVIEELVGRTEGWAAALQLAAITLRSAPDAAAAVEAFTGNQRFVIDYLADEVMTTLDPGLGDFLVRVSIVDQFDAALAGALTGRADAVELIDRAERANLFVVPLDLQRRWFRLHGLFADYLRGRVPPAQRTDLHRSAARWLEAAGMRRDAVGHAIAAGDTDEATRLIAVEGRVAFEAGELATLRAWLGSLPARATEQNADLVVLDAWTQFYAGRMAEAASLAGRHLASTRTRGPAEGRLLVLEALLATTTSAEAGDLAREGIALLDGDPLFESLGLQAAGLAQLARGDVAASLGTLRDAFARALAVGHPMAVLPAVNPLGHALEATGRRDEAEALARRVLSEYKGPSEAPLPVAWSARLVLGIAMYEGGEVAEARRELERGLAAAEVMGVGMPVMGWAVPHVALARQAAGDPDGALAILRPGPVRNGPGVELPSLAAETEARIRLLQGDLAWASRWARDAQPEAPAGSPLVAMLRRSADLTVTRVLLAEGRAADALALLEPTRAAYESWGTVPELTSTLVLEAVAHGMGGRRDQAVEALVAAIRLAAPGGYVQRFVDDGPSLRALLPSVRVLAPGFVAKVEGTMAAADDRARQSKLGRGTRVEMGVDGELVESLTGRELEVMRILATGVTNAELANQLGVSAGTAKWHVAHILAKLGARSRTQAVVRAQRLGLI